MKIRHCFVYSRGVPINMMKQYFLTMQILLLLLLLPMLMIHIVYPDRADPVLCIRSMFLFCPVQLFWMTKHKLLQNVYRKATHTPFYLIQLCFSRQPVFFYPCDFLHVRMIFPICSLMFYSVLTKIKHILTAFTAPPYCNQICTEFEFNIYYTRRQTLFYQI